MGLKLIAGISAVAAVGAAIAFAARPNGSAAQPAPTVANTRCYVDLPGGKQIAVLEALSNEDCIRRAKACLRGRAFTEIKWQERSPAAIHLGFGNEVCTSADIQKAEQSD